VKLLFIKRLNTALADKFRGAVLHWINISLVVVRQATH